VDDILSPVIVLGMHRSGTSLLAGCLEAAGLHLGDVNSAAPFNERGNKENERIRDLHESILARNECDWKRPPRTALRWTSDEKSRLLHLLQPYRLAGRPWGFKDPRAVWLLEGWLELFPDAALIAVFRHPLLVAGSLAARPGELHLPVDQGLGLWERTNRRILDHHRAAPFPVLDFSHREEGLRSRFLGPLAAFARARGLPGDAASFLDRSLVHQRLPAAELPAALLSLYDRLLGTSLACATARPGPREAAENGPSAALGFVPGH